MYYKEYQILQSSKIFTYCLAIVFITISVCFLITNHKKLELNDLTSLLKPIIFFAIIAIMISSIMYIRKAKIIITNNSIKKIGLFKTTELFIDEIEGFSYNNNTYTVVSDNGKKRQVLQFSNSFAGFEEISSWLHRNSVNTDLKIDKKNRKQAFEDELFGDSVKERKILLRKYESIAKYINWVGGVLSIWIFFYPSPYVFSVVSGIIFPFVIILILIFNNHYKLELNKNDYYPDLTTAFIFPILFLFLRTIADHNIYNYSNIWFLITIFTISLYCLLNIRNIRNIVANFKDKNKVAIDIIILLFLAFYSFSIIIFTNWYYDKPDGHVFKTKITEKVETKKTRYIKIEKWEQEKNIDRIDIDRTIYNKVKIGDTVKVKLYTGWLSIPWYELSE